MGRQTRWNLQKTCLFQAFQPSGCNISSQNQFVLIWAGPFQAKISLSWFGLAHFKSKSVCPDLGWPISSQTQFVLIWAGPSQDKISLSWFGLAHLRTNWENGWEAWEKLLFWGGYHVFCPFRLILVLHTSATYRGLPLPAMSLVLVCWQQIL